MPKIERLTNVVSKLRTLAALSQQGDNCSVIVGYTAKYAIYVHENMEIWPPGMRLKGVPRPKGQGRYWDPQGKAQPKFLEQPARDLKNELARIVINAKRQRRTTAFGLLLAGLKLQTESQRLVPVKTGLLKASAFTKLESGQE